MGKKKKGKPETDEPAEGEGEGIERFTGPHPGGVPEFSNEQNQFAPFDESTSSSGGDSSTSTSNDYGLKMDHTSGQDMAASLSQALLDEQGDELQMLMKDPIAAIANGDRIRQLSRMIQAYKGGYDLPDLEVIPHSRVAAEDFGSRTNSQSGSSGKSNRGTGWKMTGRQVRENMD